MNAKSKEDTLMSLGKLARHLGGMDNPPIIVSESTLRRWAKEGMQVVVVSGQIRCSIKWIRVFLGA